MPQAVVVGAGIGGLTSAVALRRQGWEVTVLERAAAIEPVGSGLAIAANALKALDTLGLGDRVRALSRVQGQVGIKRADGRWLTHTTPEAAEGRYDDSVVVLLRATLMEVLTDAIGPDALRLGIGVSEVDPEGGVVRTEAGEELRADLVVGADGIRSRTRQALFPRHPGPAYSGVTAWRGLVPRGELEIRSTESWGRGLVFGVNLLAGDLVYVYATDVSPPGLAGGDERAELIRRFGGWHDPIPALLRAADPALIIRSDVHHLAEPLPAYHRGRAVLVGDAAHAMTPNLGQGACQAIEDAVVLAHVAGSGGPAAYTAARLARTRKMVRRSWAVCRVTKVRNPLVAGLRDAAVSLGTRLVPDLLVRSLDEVLGWRPPGQEAAPGGVVSSRPRRP
ncbi:FAD-dependent monooxygenase [Actinomadura sp. ATCC 31491]|uniref:FAD-dependent monooxygenase n=1 Tax=Actinomadura luzonensis TaxID=2805427 RepID=A0ABT0FJY9_9ACTN|nr:FAD-dependent monooxygenase [Actinomadura luzonensis]MCK2212601.1 FAD-dependent monooxygenase [Actinomadura luzonensis]